MKKFVLSLWLATGMLLAEAQTTTTLTEPCATMPSLQHRLDNDPYLRAYMEAQAQQYRLRSGVNYDTTGYVVVPVVFHVVYNPANPEQNIHDSLIFSQMEVLNKDYSYTHAGTGTTLPIFDSIAAHTGIQFKLATVDPMGNPTNGITRTSSTTSHFLTPLTNSVKADGSGGKTPWPVNEYLNIWVCSMFPAILGYAQFPGDAPATDGVVLNYDYVGEKPGAPTAPSNLGRTATHECGHWFGMRHVWGDGGCGIDDLVQDTPDSDAASSQDCQLTRNNCTDAGNLYWGGTNPPDMVQNFMDYSADGCMTMFTRQQANRMWNKIVDYRHDLFLSNGCGTPAINGYVVTQNLSCPQACDGRATVNVVAGTAPFTYLWNDAAAQTTPVASGLCRGVYTVRVIDADNDTMFIQSYVFPQSNMAASITATTNATCSTCTEGSITVSAIGGNGDYSYTLDAGTPQAGNVFTGLMPGNYTVTVSDSCGTQIQLPVEIANTVGLNEADAGAGFAVYPNPNNGNFTLELQGVTGAYQVNIYDVTGKQVYGQLKTGPVNMVNVPLQNGVYMVNVITANGQMLVRRMVVEK